MRSEVFIRLLKGKKSRLAVLVDPDKYSPELIRLCNANHVSCFLVGGSKLKQNNLTKVIKDMRTHTALPIILFPGDETQISSEADGMLLLSLISGNNPEYLIGKHVRAAEKIKKAKIFTLPTGYILIQGDRISTTQKVTGTRAIPAHDVKRIKNTSIAGELLGLGAVYLEAGSGARTAVPAQVIRTVKKNISIPLIVGGGIDSARKARTAIKAGAQLVVVGNALENDPQLIRNIGNEFK